MSILRDYEEIKKFFSKAELHQIEMFLNAHPNYFLSDVYYSEKVYKEFEQWKDKRGDK